MNVFHIPNALIRSITYKHNRDESASYKIDAVALPTRCFSQETHPHGSLLGSPAGRS